MYKSLSPTIKSNITRSITKVFEEYMGKIDWDERRYNIEEFLKTWREYITQNSKWYRELPDEVKTSEDFHEELAQKMNLTISKIINEPPTPQQVERISVLQKNKNIDIEYTCKAEAAYVEQKLIKH